jgi:diadenosine tetraphosphatase ApaH/serine/threonine PP2A family protein phosphatase
MIPAFGAPQRPGRPTGVPSGIKCFAAGHPFTSIVAEIAGYAHSLSKSTRLCYIPVNWSVVMRYLILSDIHGNYAALREVLKQAPPHDEVLFLGDLVGYGASPNEVMEELAKLNVTGLVRGNHDKVCAGIDPGHHFNSNALTSARWTREQLTPENFNYLRELPQGPLRFDDLITIAHGSPMDEDYYILYENDAFVSFQNFDTPLCFFGHTHVPGLFVLEKSPPVFYYFLPRGDFMYHLHLDGTRQYLINPGSIGQPRDYDHRAAFCLLDTETALISYHKVRYPIEEATSKIRRANLPEFLAERLFSGV